MPAGCCRACAAPVLGSCPRSSDAPRWRPCYLWPPRRMPHGPVRRFWPRGPLWAARPDDPVARVRLRPSGRPACGSRQTRLGQLAAKKYGTISADLMRQYGTHPEKTHKSLPAVARLRADRSSRASLQADSQTPGSPPAPAASRRDADGIVGCRDMQTASKRPYRVTVAGMTPVSSPAKTNTIMPVPVPMRKGGSASNLDPIRPA